MTPEQRVIQLEAEIAGLRVERDGAVADLRNLVERMEMLAWSYLGDEDINEEKAVVLMRHPEIEFAQEILAVLGVK